MKCIVHLDMEIIPREFQTPEEAIAFVEKQFKDPELKIKWRRDEFYPENYTDYTVAQLVEEINKRGEVCLQLVGDDGQNLVIGEIANIVTEEVEKQENAEAQAELSKLGQELADSYKSKTTIGHAGQQKTFKPKSRKIKRRKK